MKNYTVLNTIKQICGIDHYLIEKRDTSRKFYVDSAFLYALEHYRKSDLTKDLEDIFNLSSVESLTILKVIKDMKLVRDPL